MLNSSDRLVGLALSNWCESIIKSIMNREDIDVCHSDNMRVPRGSICITNSPEPPTAVIYSTREYIKDIISAMTIDQ